MGTTTLATRYLMRVYLGLSLGLESREQDLGFIYRVSQGRTPEVVPLKVPLNILPIWPFIFAEGSLQRGPKT